MSSSLPPKTVAPAAETPVIRSRQVPSRRRRDGLIRYAKDVHSQNGEDGILERLFEMLPPAGSYYDSQSLISTTTDISNPTTSDAEVVTTTRWCVDLGAWDGKHLSNTYQLLFRHQQPDKSGHSSSLWRGILVEADPERVRQLQDLHRDTGNICLHVTVSTESPQDPNNLHNVLHHQHSSWMGSENGVRLPNRFDFLCIDIDGSDYWVLHDLWTCSEYAPSVVCVEFNPTMPDSLIYIPPRTSAARHGASLAALVELAEQHDYVLVETTLFNAFFVRRALYEQYLRSEVPDTSIEALHDTTMGTQLYQLYDGTLKLWGCKRMLWHRLPLDESQIQVLPQHERVFPFAPSANAPPEDDSLFRARAVDLSPYRNCRDGTVDANDDIVVDDTQDEHTAQRRHEASQQLLQQLQRDGFALVRGTGLSGRTGQAALRATHALLQDADEAVRRSCRSRQDRARRGYVPMNVENFASLLPTPTGSPQPNDLVRKFRVGPLSRLQEDEVLQSSTDERYSCRNALLQPNVWPTLQQWDEESVQTFRSDVEAYYTAACRAAQIVLQAICDGLLAEYPSLEPSLRPLMQQYASNGEKVHDTSANETTTTTTSILTLLGYRHGTRHKGKHKGPLVAAHTDVGVITLLLFDGGWNTCAKLQRREGCDDAGADIWVDVDLPSTVPRDDPILVVNVADCLAELSHGTLPSTVHRVVAVREEPQSYVPRNCCALFVGLDPDCELPLGDKDTPVISYEEWRKRRIARSQIALKEAAAPG